MDPNANLEETRKTVAAIIHSIDSEEEWGPDRTEAMIHDANRLAELVQALDGWISAGGFLPQAWSRS